MIQIVVPILLYGAEVWAASGKFTPDKWEKTAVIEWIAKIHQITPFLYNSIVITHENCAKNIILLELESPH